MDSSKKLKILHLCTHINAGGITSYVTMVGARFVRMGHSVWVASSGGEKEEAIKAKGVRILRIPIRTKAEISPRILFSLPKVLGLIRREKIDLLHAHTRVTQVLAALASFLTRVPYVTTAHGFYKPRFSRRLFGSWGRKVVAISPLVAEDLEKRHKVEKSKIRIVQNAIDIEDFESRLSNQDRLKARQMLRIPSQAVVVGSVARLVRDKGHEYLLKAVRDLKKKYKNLYLLIVGDGREKRRLWFLIHKMGLKKDAQILESVSDMSMVYAAMDIFALAATYREGFGLALVEAMVAKKPVVATDIWAINSIIRNRINGFLVEPKKKEALSQAIAFAMDHPQQVESIVHNAYEIATQLYTMDRLVSELETVYREAMDGV